MPLESLIRLGSVPCLANTVEQNIALLKKLLDIWKFRSEQAAEVFFSPWKVLTLFNLKSLSGELWTIILLTSIVT